MKRQARCWICGSLFEAERGSLPKGARFTCEPCGELGLAHSSGKAELSRALYERHGVPYMELSEVAVEEEVLRLVPEDFARHHAVMPVMLAVRKKATKPTAGDSPAALVVAIADPGNAFAIAAIEKRAGRKVQACVSTWAEIADAIGEQYVRIAAHESDPAADEDE